MKGEFVGRYAFMEGYGLYQNILGKNEYNNFKYVKDKDGFMYYGAINKFDNDSTFKIDKATSYKVDINDVDIENQNPLDEKTLCFAGDSITYFFLFVKQNHYIFNHFPAYSTALDRFRPSLYNHLCKTQEDARR